MKTLEIITTLAAVPAVRHPHSIVIFVFNNIPSPLPPAVIEAIMLVLHGLLSFINVSGDFFAFASHPLVSPLPAIFLIYLMPFGPCSTFPLCAFTITVRPRCLFQPQHGTNPGLLLLEHPS